MERKKKENTNDERCAALPSWGSMGFEQGKIKNNREETADGENLIQYRIPPTQCRAEYQ